MMRPRSLRRMLIAGMTAIAVVGGGVLVAVMLLFSSLRTSFDSDMRAQIIEQRAADEIMTSVYGQILASYRQLHAPSARNMERFDSLGHSAYARLREYLFQPMPIEARLQVETIKEIHQTLEVDAHLAFDLVGRGDAASARAHIAEMERRAGLLEAEMDRFVELRERERTRVHEAQVDMLWKLLAGIALIGVVLVVYASLFVRLVQRRVVAPLGQLSTAARQIGAGDLAARIPDQRHEELATVARSFNDMAQHMQSARDEIEAQNTELTNALENLKRTQQELVQQEKLAAMGFMLAGLAHELNNPLAGILGAAQCVEEELAQQNDPHTRKVLDELVRPLTVQARRAGDLVRNLLQFSRKSNAQVDAVNLGAALEVAAGLRAHAFALAGKSLVLDAPPDVYVAIESQRLEHVAMNVMSNALDAMRTGGGEKLVVRATPATGGWVTLVFEDDGPGFKEPERVFDAFYTTKEVGTGTGLGLTLVHQFVEEAGGTILIENAPGGGARLTIRLRAAAPPAGATVNASSLPHERVVARLTPRFGHATLESIARTPAMAAPAPNGAAPGTPSRTVLVVDDEPIVRDIQRRFLSMMGVQVLLASDGTEAIEVLKREHCDLVITDLRMPGEIDGLALYEWIKETRPELAERCMFVTGDIVEWGSETVLGAHPERVLSKPFHRDEYVKRVQEAFQRAEAMA